MATESLESILKLAPVVPVLVIEEVADALPLARALVKGGLPVLEITLRTDKALDCIRAIIERSRRCHRRCRHGARRRPARTGRKARLRLRGVAGLDRRSCSMPPRTAPSRLLPGCRDRQRGDGCCWNSGYRFQKFFPAEPAGGVSYLSALASPLPQIRFCPTGGITPGNALGLSGAPQCHHHWRLLDGARRNSSPPRTGPRSRCSRAKRRS